MAWWGLAGWWLALMTGILALAREVFGLYSPNQTEAIAKKRFWACVRIAFIVSAAMAWVGEYQRFTSEHEGVVSSASDLYSERQKVTDLAASVSRWENTANDRQGLINQQQALVNQYLLSPRPDTAGLLKALAALQSKPDPTPSPLKKRAQNLAANMLDFLLVRSRSRPQPLSGEELGRRLAAGESIQSIRQSESQPRSTFDIETAAEFATKFGVEMIAVSNALSKAAVADIRQLRFECNIAEMLQQCAEDIGAAADQLH